MSFRFLTFEVYDEAKGFHKMIFNLAKDFPSSERFVLTDQLRRSALSVVLNIAEGADRDSDRDFNRYVIHALGSLNETVAAVDVAADLGYITAKERSTIFGVADRLSRRLAALRSRLTGVRKS